MDTQHKYQLKSKSETRHPLQKLQKGWCTTHTDLRQATRNRWQHETSRLRIY